MRVSTVAIYTLAAFATQELSHEANADTSRHFTQEPEASNFVAAHDSTTPTLTEAIAPPESLEAQAFATKVAGVGEGRREGERERGRTPLRTFASDLSGTQARRQDITGAMTESKPSPLPIASDAELPSQTELQSIVPIREGVGGSKGEGVNVDSDSADAVFTSSSSDEVLVGQQSPAGTPNNYLPSQEEIQRLQTQLQALEETAKFGNVYEGSPSLTIVTPTGFGADRNTGFVSATYQARTRFTNEDDGALGIGIGLGNAQRAVGVELSYAIASFGNNRDFGTGGFNVKVHRRLADDLAVAVGWNGFLNIGDDNDFEDSIYGVATKIFRTRDKIDLPFSRVAVSAGLGSGQFRSEDDVADDDGSVNVFGSVAVRVVRPVSLIAEWTGQDLGLGLSIVPFKNLPLVVTPAVRDITGAGDGARFVVGTGFSFRF